MAGHVAKADSKITGFASFAAGTVLQGDAFLADYPNTGVYDNDWSFTPDSTIGIQLKTDIADNYSFIVQVVSNSASGGDMELEWAYLNYQYQPDLAIQVGRKHLPLYYYSDVYDIGYAYNWIRPPSDNYTWQISSYNGVSLNYEPVITEWDALFSIYFGREDSEQNRLLTYLEVNKAPVDETWKNIVGMVAEISNENFEIRAAMMGSELDRINNGTVTHQNVDQVFSGLSVNFYYNAFSVLTEFNRYQRKDNDIDVSTYMVSLAYKIADFTPHITHSEFKQKMVLNKREHHYTTSVGVRWDIENNIALKLQYDKTIDEGMGAPILGDGELLSIALDMVF